MSKIEESLPTALPEFVQILAVDLSEFFGKQFKRLADDLLYGTRAKGGSLKSMLRDFFVHVLNVKVLNVTC